MPPPNFLFLESGIPGDGSQWQSIDSTGGPWADNNPALWIDPDNGSVILVYKVGCECPPPCQFCRQFGLATAPSWQGPYSDQGLVPIYGEDAYIWRDIKDAPGGGFHMIFQGGNYSPIFPTYVGHWHTAYSSDGLNWQVEVNSVVFNSTIPLASGGVLELGRRERHQIVMDTASGAPAFLFNGANLANANDDHTFTTVQPIVHG